MQCFRDARQVAQSYRLHASSDISSAMKKQGRKGAGFFSADGFKLPHSAIAATEQNRAVMMR